eukprot:gene3969-5689_t
MIFYDSNSRPSTAVDGNLTNNTQHLSPSISRPTTPGVTTDVVNRSRANSPHVRSSSPPKYFNITSAIEDLERYNDSLSGSISNFQDSPIKTLKIDVDSNVSIPFDEATFKSTLPDLYELLYASSSDDLSSLQEGGDGSVSLTSIRNKTKVDKLLQEPSPLTIRYHNTGGWVPAIKSARIEILKFKLTQDILFREDSLFKIAECLNDLDQAYWMYCVERIQSTEIHRSLNNESIIWKKNKVFRLQHALSILIAHLRGLTISIIQKVLKLRKLYFKEYQAVSTITIYWHENNYLLKMMNDAPPLLDSTQTIKMWLGFIPNMFMLPSNHDHNPKLFWQTNQDNVHKYWLKNHREYILNVRKLSVLESTGFRKTLTISKSRSNSSIPLPHSLDQASLDETGNGNSSSGDMHDNHNNNDNNNINNSNNNNNNNMKKSSSLLEWEQLREYGYASYGTSNIIGMEHSLNNAPEFWNNLQHNPYVIEAITGFEDVLPRIFIVPPLPIDLLKRCKTYEVMLKKESLTEDLIADLKEESLILKQNIEERIINSANQSISSYHDSYHDNENDSYISKEELKLRQQNNPEILSTIIIRKNNNNNNFHPLKSPSKGSKMNSSSLPALVTNKSILPKYNNNSYVHEGSSFITESVSTFNYQLPLDLMSSSGKNHNHYHHNNDNNSSTIILSKSTSSLTEGGIFLLENSKIKSKFEMKVKESRSFIESKYSHYDDKKVTLPLLPIIKYNKIGRRELPRLEEKYYLDKVVKIQLLIRRKLALLKMKSIRNHNERLKKLKTVYFFVHTVIKFRKRRYYRFAKRAEMLLIRKMALRKFNASLKITKCIRNYVNNKRELNDEPLLMSKFAPEKLLQTYGTNTSTLTDITAATDMNHNNITKEHQLLLEAKSLIHRVNKGKVMPDSVHTSRLIPIKHIHDKGGASIQVKAFTKKEYTFLRDPNDKAPLHHTINDVYVGPIPKSKTIVAAVEAVINKNKSENIEYNDTTVNQKYNQNTSISTLSQPLSHNRSSKRNSNNNDSSKLLHKSLILKQEKETKAIHKLVSQYF